MPGANELDKVLLENASPDLQKQFLELIRDQKDSEELQKTHRCWLFVPSPSEYERMKRFATSPDYDKCPKCGNGRIIVEVRNWSMGQGLHLVCKWSRGGCDFDEYISDPE